MKGVTRIPEPFDENRYLEYTWDRESIMRHAPEASGVYGLYNGVWIHVGEAEDIRSRLLEHLGGDCPCISHYEPSGFAFELVAPKGRHRRVRELTQQTEPICRRKVSLGPGAGKLQWSEDPDHFSAKGNFSTERIRL